MKNEFVIDAGPMGGGITGAGRYAFKLLDEVLSLEPDIPLRIIIPPSNKYSWDTNSWSNYENVILETADITGFGLSRALYYAYNRPSCSVHHSLSSYIPFFIDSNQTLVTIHDLKQFMLPESSEKLNLAKRSFVKYRIKRSAKVADHIITVSEHTKSDLTELFNIAPKDISVIPLGPGSGKVDVYGDPPVSKPFILFIGEIRPHKNIHTLIEAYQQYKQENGCDIDLVIAGSTRNNYQAELEEIIDDKYRSNIHFLGHVNDETVALLYSHATLFVFPSLYEGFGLPPIEAMGYDTPVIASNRASIPEVVGDAGEYFDPSNTEELTSKLEAVLNDKSLHNQLIKKGRNRYEEFSWERTARETLDVYRRVWDLTKDNS